MPLKIAAGLTGTLGLTALILAMAGLYGVLSHVVACRTAEIGVRMALGASAGRIQWMLLRDGLRPIIGGLVLGLTLAMILWLSLRPLFLRLLPETDALILGIVPMVFLGVGCLAGYFPARRAARIDPKAALRYL